MKISRIVQNVIIDNNGCWIWQKSCNSAGYGQLTENKKYWLAHRYAYACVNSNLNDNLVIRHICHNTKCCNPDHLVLGTQKDNYHDSIEKHKEADSKKRSIWIINNITYTTIRDASEKTGISQNSLTKYTINGVFDINSYRLGCKKANVKPKV